MRKEKVWEGRMKVMEGIIEEKSWDEYNMIWYITWQNNHISAVDSDSVIYNYIKKFIWKELKIECTFSYCFWKWLMFVWTTNLESPCLDCRHVNPCMEVKEIYICSAIYQYLSVYCIIAFTYNINMWIIYTFD